FGLFFFSRRRRQTRWVSDWSSDVCSSDLYDGVGRPYRKVAKGPVAGQDIIRDTVYNPRGLVAQESRPHFAGEPPAWTSFTYDARSEERRVGKEGGYRGAGDH